MVRIVNIINCCFGFDNTYHICQLPFVCYCFVFLINSLDREMEQLWSTLKHLDPSGTKAFMVKGHINKVHYGPNI